MGRMKDLLIDKQNEARQEWLGSGHCPSCGRVRGVNKEWDGECIICEFWDEEDSDGRIDKAGSA